MNSTTFDFILNLVRKNINENAVPPTNFTSSGAVSGLTGNEGDLPPVDLRKKKFKNLPYHYKKLVRRNSRVQ